MSDIFRSAKSVLRRAGKHIENLENELRIPRNQQPFAYKVDFDEKLKTYIHKVVFDEGFCEDLSCIMFDAVNNMRSSLDQMTFAIATKFTGKDISKAYFPFAKSAIEWSNNTKKIQYLPPAIIARFKSFQPYKGGNDTLWALNFIANTKKHALLIPVSMGMGLISRKEGKGYEVAFRMIDRPDNEIFLGTSNSPEPDKNINFSYSMQIRHNETVIDRKSPVHLLKAIKLEVDHILFETEKDYCRNVLF